MAETGKACSQCQVSKPASEFSKKQWAAKAHSRKCKACTDAGDDNTSADAPQPPAAMESPPVVSGQMAKCGDCGRTISKKSGKCSKCLAVFYCNVTCQRNHWKEHKLNCGTVCYMCLVPFDSRNFNTWACCQRKICEDCVMINYSMLPEACELCQQLQELGSADQIFSEAFEIQQKARETADRHGEKPGSHSSTSAALFSRAAKKYKQALTINPKTRFAQCNLGVVLFELGKFHEAAPMLRKAIQQDPTDAKAHYVMGMICALAQNRDDALLFLDRAVTLIRKPNPSPAESEVIADYEQTHRELLACRIFPPPPLRFAVGDQVQCQCREGWLLGEVVDLWYRESEWPPERPSAPYQVQLFRGGVLIYAVSDNDNCIRLPPST